MRTMLLFVLVAVAKFWDGVYAAGEIKLGSRLLAKENQSWVSDNGTFAFGFTPAASADHRKSFQLAIWFAQLPGDPTVVWSAYLKSPVTKDAVLEFDTSGNLVLIDGEATAWSSNTSRAGVETAVMSENVSQELTSSKSPYSHAGGYYALKMLQQTTSLSLALTYNLPESSNSAPESYSNYSYWEGPEISNVTGEVVAVLDEAGSLGIVYGSSSDGAVYVYKNDNDSGGIYSAVNKSYSSPIVPRRLILESNGNIRLYRWDNDVNGSRQWVAEWAAVSNPCDIAGVCGNGICNLDRKKTNASCTCLPETTSDAGDSNSCYGNPVVIGECKSHRENSTSEYKIESVQQTNYYFSDSSVIANYSDIPTVTKCGDACLSDCNCVASVYGLDEEKAYCWILKSLEFGGYEDPGSTMFLKVDINSKGGKSEGDSMNKKTKTVVLPIVLSIIALIILLCCLLYINVHRKRSLRRALQNSLIVSGSPVNFSFRDLQSRTRNFSQLLGTGGFGSVYKGSLADETLIAVKKLDKMLPHGQREFITEVNTIGSMHHMNLVRLCGYCSEGSQRLLVYEFMKNGSLDNYGMLLLEIIGGRRNFDMTCDAEDFFFPGWAFKEMTNGTPTKVADRRLEGRVDEEEVTKALRVAFWCIQEDISMRPSMGEVVKMLEGADDIILPPIPQTVSELIEEGLDHVYKAMKREFNQFSSFTITSTTHPSSHATCSYSTMSPR
ncbi:G-type lectin S-receptor-like serine/threonine-protein kinase [Heracleum sosnowskyi]|uniref:G-type lectin S-receptor-like serine/threonine-protein kinase n=1 Tax=Heracleum sosnowskyi TaxID=360622 RepID=A0AAD8H533_9APIA|nr:G-type lectin S-receptor-like serine/threonine-protein kinase [Heracleum sosnowskyi]